MRNKAAGALLIRILLAGAVLLILLAAADPPVSRAASGETPSRAECVIEVSSRRILHERNAHTDLPMASTTKILTAILIIDDCDLDEVFPIPKEAEGVEGSSVYLRAGEEYSVRDLLYGLMLRSGNDCAVALALHHSGSVEEFARRMNEKAAMLGAEDSYFVNPHGLPDKRHKTTACDLALISAYAMENETFREIVGTKYYVRHNWKNKNKMLWEYDGATGVKTGFTVSAGRCLVTSAERNGMKLVCVVLDSPQMYERTAQLLDEAYRDYELYTLCEAGCNGGLYARESFRYPLTKEERKKIKIGVEKSDPLPSRAGEIAGQMKITLENNLLFSQNLYMMKS